MIVSALLCQSNWCLLICLNTKGRHNQSFNIMTDYFVFPVNFKDLEEEPANHDRYRVFLQDLAFNDKEIIRKLKAIDSAFNQNYSVITDPDIFDFLYSLIKCFSENIEAKSTKVLEELSSTIQYITEMIFKHLKMLSEDSNISVLRQSFKMVIFLCLYFISVTAIKKQKVQGDLMAEAMNKEKGKRKIKTDSFDPTRLLLENQKSCINLIKETLQINFVVLWERKQIDSEIFKKYVDVCVKILESNLVRENEVSNCIFDILETILTSNYCQTVASSFQTVLANLVYEGDVIDNIVAFVAQAKGPELLKIITQALSLVVIYLVNKQNLSSQAQSIKNTRQFLTKVSEKIPRIFHTNLSCFICLFKHESYHLRNAIVDIMVNVFKFVFSVEEAQEVYQEPREKFISAFLQRIYDKSSFCRSHVLGCLANLAAEKIVQKKYLILFLKAGIDRIKDQSINVRKKALQLINIVIDELCTQQIASSISDIDRQIQIAELEIKTLQQQQEKLKGLIDQTDNEEQLEQLISNVKLLKKQMKITQDRQINLFENKQTNNLVCKTIENIQVLLGSKADTDVLQTIKLFIKLHKLGFEKAKEVLPDIRILIFSKQKKIKDEVLTNFVYMHLGKSSELVAVELINLFASATPQDHSALQQILETIISESLSKNIVIIKPVVFSHMWNSFIRYQREQINELEKRAIITILRIAFSRDNSLIKEQNVESFLSMLKAYVQNNQPDFHIVKQISKIICIDVPIISRVAKNFLVAQIYILVNTQGVSNNQWFSTCESILTCIFKICESPERLVNLLVKKLHEKLQITKSTKSLCHFIHTLSHSCLKSLIFMDSIENKIKAMKQKELMLEGGENEEELDKVMGGAQAQFDRKIEEINMIAEKMLEDPFINRWFSYIEKIVINYKNNTQLEMISTLAYCKFLCLGSSFCEQKFNHVAKLLNNSNVNSIAKNNIIIAMGDLLHRFPNVIQPYNKYLYMNLHEQDPRVRKTTLTVITHLSLNDMIKVKSDMCDIALLFQDPDPEIEGLVKQFFNQMNKKDPKVLFNLIPDALNRFSNVEKLGNQSTFKIFIQNIVPLLEKDKYSESLVAKLCQRLANSLNMLEIANTAYCLSEININEKGIKKILQNFQNFRKTLDNPQVLQSFKNIVTKLKKSQKNELKPLIEELDQKIAHFNEEIFNAEEVKKRNQTQQEKLLKKQQRKKGQKKMISSKRSKKSQPMNIEEEDQEWQQDQSAWP